MHFQIYGEGKILLIALGFSPTTGLWPFKQLCICNPRNFRGWPNLKFFFVSFQIKMSTSTKSRCWEVTESVVRLDVREMMVLAYELTIHDYDSILLEIDNYHKGREANGRENIPSEETTSEHPCHTFTVITMPLSQTAMRLSVVQWGVNQISFHRRFQKGPWRKPSSWIKSMATTSIAFSQSPVSLQTTLRWGILRSIPAAYLCDIHQSLEGKW